MNAAHCDEVADLLEPFVDGELSAAEHDTVALHLRDCAKCQGQVQELRELAAKLKRLAPYRAPSELSGRLRDKLAAERSAGWQPGWRTWATPIASHAAAVLIGLAAGYWLILADTRTENLSEQLVAAHVRSLMAGQPIDVASSDQHHVGPWFAGKLDFAPKVRDLSAQGFPLIGGRVDYFDGRRVAVVVFRRREHTINVFIAPHGGGFPLPQGESRRNGYNIESWTDGEYDFWAVSDLNRDELAALAKAFRAA